MDGDRGERSFWCATKRGGAGRRTDVNYTAALMAQELFESRGQQPRSEALPSKPGIGEKVTAALRGINFRTTLGAVEAPGLPALLDYPNRS
jgi:hypothetical protein